MTLQDLNSAIKVTLLKLLTNLIVWPIPIHINCSNSHHIVTIPAVLCDCCYVDAIAVATQELWHLVVDVLDFDPQTGKICGSSGSNWNWLFKVVKL